MSITLSQYQIARDELEASIAERIDIEVKHFEAKTGVTVSEITVQLGEVTTPVVVFVTTDA